MRKIKPEFNGTEEQQGIVILQNIPHQGLVKANRTLLLIASTLMVVVFVLGFLLVPEEDILGGLQAKHVPAVKVYSVENPVLSAEIKILKGQLVGLVSGSIESKLRSLEISVRKGSTADSLGTIQDLKNDVKVLQAYSTPEKIKVESSQANQALLQEVSHLKRLIYLTITSCGLIVAAIAGVWVRRHFYLADQNSKKVITLGK